MRPARRNRPLRSALTAATCALLLVVTGCSSYAIEGRVIRGQVAMIQVVDRDDPRMTEPNPTGGGAVVTAVLEPDTPTERLDLGRHLTNGQGWFKIPVDAFGSGILEYEVQLVVRRQGHRGTMQIIDLPRGSKRVLVTLPLGADTLAEPERFRDRALRDAKPYLEDN